LLGCVSKCLFVFALALDVMRDLSSLSSMQSRDIVAVVSSKTNLGLSQETEQKVMISSHFDTVLFIQNSKYFCLLSLIFPPDVE